MLEPSTTALRDRRPLPISQLYLSAALAVAGLHYGELGGLGIPPRPASATRVRWALAGLAAASPVALSRQVSADSLHKYFANKIST